MRPGGKEKASTTPVCVSLSGGGSKAARVRDRLDGNMVLPSDNISSDRSPLTPCSCITDPRPYQATSYFALETYVPELL